MLVGAVIVAVECSPAVVIVEVVEAEELVCEKRLEGVVVRRDLVEEELDIIECLNVTLNQLENSRICQLTAQIVDNIVE